MSSERDLLYLTHIAETVELVRSAGPSSREALEADPNLHDATLYRLQTLSESASLLSPALKDRHPEIPWAAISGFRNRLVHGYTEVRSEGARRCRSGRPRHAAERRSGPTFGARVLRSRSSVART